MNTSRFIVSLFAAAWMVAASISMIYILITGWISPTNDVLIHLNDFGEMWIEVPLMMISFTMFVVWGIIKLKEVEL